MTHFPTPRRAAALTACLLAGLALQPASLAEETASPPAALEPAFVIPNDDEAIEHVLNRLGYGPRPGDVERVRAMGLGRYIDEQLHPERLADAAADRLKRISVLDLEGVPVETSVVFGDRAVEIGLEAECFDADLVVVPWSPRPGPAARMRLLARRLLAGRRAHQFDVLSVSALRAEPTR